MNTFVFNLYSLVFESIRFVLEYVYSNFISNVFKNESRRGAKGKVPMCRVLYRMSMVTPAQRHTWHSHDTKCSMPQSK